MSFVRSPAHAQALESLFLAARDSGEEMDTKFKLYILEVYDDKVKNLLTQRQRAKFEDVDIGDSSESRESGKLLYDYIYDTRTFLATFLLNLKSFSPRN